MTNLCFSNQTQLSRSSILPLPTHIDRASSRLKHWLQFGCAGKQKFSHCKKEIWATWWGKNKCHIIMFGHSWSYLTEEDSGVSLRTLSTRLTNWATMAPKVNIHKVISLLCVCFPEGKLKLTSLGGSRALFYLSFVLSEVCWWIMCLAKVCHASKKRQRTTS